MQEEGSAYPGAGTAAKVEEWGPSGRELASSSQTSTDEQTFWAQRTSCSSSLLWDRGPNQAYCSFIKTIITSEMTDSLEDTSLQWWG